MPQEIVSTTAVAEHDQSVTAIISVAVPPGRERAYEEWVQGVNEAAQTMGCYRRAELFRPIPGGNDPRYTSVLRFKNLAALQMWQASAERHAWLKKLHTEIVSGEPELQISTGLEFWFREAERHQEEAHPNSVPSAPPRWKQATASFLGVWPIVLLLTLTVVPYLHYLPLPLATAMTSATISLLMAYVVMPRVTRWLAPWLFRHAATKIMAPTGEKKP